MKNKFKIYSNDSSRFVTAILIILAVLSTIIILSIYNISAVLMLFGNCKLNLRDFSKTSNIIKSDNQDFKSIKISGNEENGSIIYSTYDDVASFKIQGEDNTTIYIYAKINLQKFANLDLTSKYRSLDNMISPILINSDVLAGKISLIRISSNLAISGLTTGKLSTNAMPIKKMNTEFSIYNTDLIIKAILN